MRGKVITLISSSVATLTSLPSLGSLPNQLLSFILKVKWKIDVGNIAVKSMHVSNSRPLLVLKLKISGRFL